jgi:hypothetical protein
MDIKKLKQIIREELKSILSPLKSPLEDKGKGIGPDDVKTAVSSVGDQINSLRDKAEKDITTLKDKEGEIKSKSQVIDKIEPNKEISSKIKLVNASRIKVNQDLIKQKKKEISDMDAKQDELNALNNDIGI